LRYKHKRNKDGYFKESWLTDEILPSGNKRRIVIRDKDYKIFLSKLDEAKRLHKKGISLDNTTVAEWSERWFAVYKSRASDEQKAHFRAKLDYDIIPVIGDMRVKDIRASHLQDLLNQSSGKKGTVVKIRHVIKQLFESAENEGIIERDPARKLELPDNLDESPRRPLTDIECNIVWKVAQSHPAGVYVMTMLLCGLRRGECVGLTIEDIDFENKRISVKKAIRYTSNQGVEKKPKTDAGIRQMPIPDILVPMLKNQCKNKDYNVHVFTKVDGDRATGIAVRRWWESFLRQCHIESGAKLFRNSILLETSNFGSDITPHYLRHTYATDIHAAGVHEKEQKHFLGHKSHDVTDIYREISNESFNRAAEVINQYLQNKYMMTETHVSINDPGDKKGTHSNIHT